MPPRIKAAVPLALLLLVAMVGVLAVAAAPAAAEHGTENNLTLVYSSHEPGATEQTVTVYAEEHNIPDGGFGALNWIIVTSEATSFAPCGAGNARAIGIDRGNNNSGTRTDVALTSRVKDQNIGQDSFMAQFYKEEDIGGDPTSLYNEDQVVARLADCFENPSEPGWYQWTGDINGTTVDGNYEEYEMASHYVYICQCESRQEAVDTLGAPPGQTAPGSTPTATAAPDDTPTATESTSNTATQAPADTPTATDSTGDTQTATDATGGGSTPTDATGGDSGNQQQNTDAAQQTPAPADGPGFGAVIALVALATTALLALRRPR